MCDWLIRIFPHCTPMRRRIRSRGSLPHRKERQMKSILRSGVIAAALIAGSVQTTRAEHAAASAPATSQPASAGPVDYKKLKELVPDKLTDLKRTNLEGQKISAGDLSM